VDVLAITFVTACSALVSAAAGPVVSVIVSTRQIRASLVSNNREQWTVALRDSLAEYVALVVSAAILEEAQQKGPLIAIRDDPRLASLAERIAQAKNRILLMVNPADPEHLQLVLPVEQAYRLLLEGNAPVKQVASCADAITNAGRVVLRREWARVKRGD
jgi:hypothetical protein